MDLLLLIYYNAAGVYNMTQTVCILYERHTCSMCMRSKEALSVHDNADTLAILSKKYPVLFCIDCSFFYFHFYHTLLQTVFHAFRSPCDLNASIPKQGNRP